MDAPRFHQAIKLHHDLEEQLHQNSQLMADNSARQVRCGGRPPTEQRAHMCACCGAVAAGQWLQRGLLPGVMPAGTV